MRAAALAFAASAAAGLVLTPLVRDLAQRWGLLDHALTSRKIHGKPVPRLGGVAIAAAFFAPLAGLMLLDGDVGHRFHSDALKALGLFAGGLGIVVVGVVDDVRGLRARHKLLGQLAVAALAYGLGYRIDEIALPFGAPIPLGLLGLPFTVLWITGVINALNLIDGLDGLAGGVALAAVGSTLAIAALNGEPLMLLVTAALAGATLAFLVFNFSPASIFMGDTGSMFLGFVLAITAIETNQKSSTAVAILVPVVALALPILDTLLSMARRAARGVPMFQADRGHVHHRLLDLGLSHRRAALVLYGFSALLGLGAVALSLVRAREAVLLLVALGAAHLLFLRRLGYFDLRRAPALLRQRRRNLELREAIRRVGELLREAEEPWEIFVALRFAVAPLGASAIALRLPELQGAPPEGFSEGFEGRGGEDLLRARFGLAVGLPGRSEIEVAWTDGRDTVDRDTEIAIEILCGHVAGALERAERSRARPEDVVAAWQSTG
jgi:UDP-GlcNAc:undecaprenyl-phosphate GlcNAc-1-phosphate transferase